MEIDKSKVLTILRERGLDGRAAWVDRQLPDRIDVSTNVGLFSTLEINPADLADDKPADDKLADNKPADEGQAEEDLTDGDRAGDRAGEPAST